MNCRGKESSNADSTNDCCCSVGCVSRQKIKGDDTTGRDDLPLQELLVDGASCDGCVSKIEKALLAVPGAKQISMNLDTGIATVTGTANFRYMVSAIEGAGFHATAKKTKSGMNP